MAESLEAQSRKVIDDQLMAAGWTIAPAREKDRLGSSHPVALCEEKLHLAEQHQIVAEVEALTTAIDHLEAELNRQITRSNRLRQSTLAAAFSGKLV